MDSGLFVDVPQVVRFPSPNNCGWTNPPWSGRSTCFSNEGGSKGQSATDATGATCTAWRGVRWITKPP